MIKFTETIKCNSYQEFLEEVQKKFENTTSGYSMYSGKFISYDVRTPEQIKEVRENLENEVNLPIILDELEDMIGKKVKGLFGEGTLVGIEISHEDYYWIVVDDSSKEIRESCVGQLEKVN